MTRDVNSSFANRFLVVEFYLTFGNLYVISLMKMTKEINSKTGWQRNRTGFWS